jgi:hypothetical protein
MPPMMIRMHSNADNYKSFIKTHRRRKGSKTSQGMHHMHIDRALDIAQVKHASVAKHV